MSGRARGRRRSVRVIALAVGFTLAGGAAFAYWTSQGSGGGTSTTKATVADVVVSQNTSVGVLAPGETVPLAGTLTNPNNTDVKVGTLTAEITGVSNGAAISDFSIGGNDVAVNAVVKKGSPIAWSGMTLSYANSDVNQDNGKAAMVSIKYTLTPFVEPPSTGTMTYVNNVLTLTGVAVWPTATGDIAIQAGDLLGYKSVSAFGTAYITVPGAVITNGVLSYTSAPFGYLNHGPLVIKRGSQVFERSPVWNPYP